MKSSFLFNAIFVTILFIAIFSFFGCNKNDDLSDKNGFMSLNKFINPMTQKIHGLDKSELINLFKSIDDLSQKEAPDVLQMRFNVVQKLDSNLYECVVSNYGIQQSFILETVYTEFNSIGLANMIVVKVGEREVMLKNGFSKDSPVFLEISEEEKNEILAKKKAYNDRKKEILHYFLNLDLPKKVYTTNNISKNKVYEQIGDNSPKFYLPYNAELSVTEASPGESLDFPPKQACYNIADGHNRVGWLCSDVSVDKQQQIDYEKKFGMIEKRPLDVFSTDGIKTNNRRSLAVRIIESDNDYYLVNSSIGNFWIRHAYVFTIPDRIFLSCRKGWYNNENCSSVFVAPNRSSNNCKVPEYYPFKVVDATEDFFKIELPGYSEEYFASVDIFNISEINKNPNGKKTENPVEFTINSAKGKNIFPVNIFKTMRLQERVGKISKGDRIKVMFNNGDFAEIETESGIKGWIKIQQERGAVLLEPLTVSSAS